MLTRLLTGVILAPGLVALVLYGPSLAIFALFVLASAAALSELMRMALPPSEAPAYERAVGVVAGLLPMFGGYAAGDVGLAGGMAAGSIGAMVAVLVRPEPMATVGRRTGMVLATVAYVGVLFAFASQMLTLGDSLGRGAIMTLFLTVWLGDTLAYFAGRGFGRHKLYEKISPKKTIEGSLGGLAGSIVGAFVARAWLLPGLTVLDCVLIGAGAAILEQVGDLCESMFKRSFDVKDSGRLLPGHGGMLDRVDGLLFAAPFIYLYLRF